MSSVAVYPLPDRKRVASEARELYAKLTQMHPISAADLRVDASQLGQTLLGPVASQLGKKRLVIVPDGVLNYIPFSILGTISDTTSSLPQPLLIVDHEIVILPSASTLAVLRMHGDSHSPATKRLAVMADLVFTKDDERFGTSSLTKDSHASAVTNNSVRPQDLQTELLRNQLAHSIEDSGNRGETNLRRLQFSRREADNIASLVP